MTTALITLTIIASILLVLFVLIQNPKGGGLSQNISSSSQLFGVQKTTDILEKGTWVLIAAIVLFSLAINFSITDAGKPTQVESKVKRKIEQSSVPSANPTSVNPVTADPLKK